MAFPDKTKFTFLVALLSAALTQTQCLEFTFRDFQDTERSQVIFGSNTSTILFNAIQVTADVSGASIANLSGRVLHRERLGLLARRGANANTVAIEFDTRKSYPEDLDDNHVGLDVNSVYSEDLSINLGLWGYF